MTASVALDALIQSFTPAQIPAVSLVVYHHGQKYLEQTWGYIDPETQNLPVQTSTRFDIASLTKLYTITAFLALVSEGKVTLETPLVDIIPEFGRISPRPLDGGQDPHSKQALPTPTDKQGKFANPAEITFWHLLTHTSGFSAWRDVYNKAGNAPPPPTTSNPEEKDRWQHALQALYEYPFVSSCDGIVRYSDIGLMLLGEATARLSGVSTLEEVINARSSPPYTPIFNPVRSHGIALSQLVPTENDPTWRKRRVWGEVHDENACGLGGIAGHAGLFATADQIAWLGQAWLNQNPLLGIDPVLMHKATQVHAQTGNERRGLGWMIRSLQGSSAGDLFSEATYGHTGFTGTSLYIDPVNEIVVALLTNGVYYGREVMPTYEFRRAVHHQLAKELLS